MVDVDANHARWGFEGPVDRWNKYTIQFPSMENFTMATHHSIPYTDTSTAISLDFPIFLTRHIFHLHYIQKIPIKNQKPKRKITELLSQKDESVDTDESQHTESDDESLETNHRIYKTRQKPLDKRFIRNTRHVGHLL